ncbi:MAG: hypothetical protein LBD64_05840 [Odoribacteraceae bacterium]|nr:hypothetical protein [Odoribacteraceae bacterium]
MNVPESLFLEATALVQSREVPEASRGVYACGCFGCGLGCAGTVGMD